MSHIHFCDGCGEKIEDTKYKSYSSSKYHPGHFDLCPKCQTEFESFYAVFQEPINDAIQALKASQEHLWDMWLMTKQGKIKEGKVKEVR